MNSIAKPSFYFSAYPLKAVKTPEEANKPVKSPYLRALLSGKRKPESKARVFPMINPYTEKFKQTPHHTDRLPKDVGMTEEKEWFKNYE